jgi:large subunit ribosomal protein L4e
LFKIDIIFPCSFQEEASAIKAAGKAWYNTMVSDSDYAEFDNFSKWLGVSQ